MKSTTIQQDLIPKVIEAVDLIPETTDRLEGVAYISDIVRRMVAESAEEEYRADFLPMLNRLCKKIDVAPYIREAYDSGLVKGIDPTPVNTQTLYVLLLLLIREAGHRRSFKYLNSALKLRDKLITAGFEIPSNVSIDLDTMIVELMNTELLAP